MNSEQIKMLRDALQAAEEDLTNFIRGKGDNETLVLLRDVVREALAATEQAARPTVEEMAAWLETDEGKARIAESQARCRASVAALNEARKIAPAAMHEPYTHQSPPQAAPEGVGSGGARFYWLVELLPAFEGHPAFDATYYAGWMTRTLEAVRTQDPYATPRFSRKEDAEQVAKRLGHTLSCIWTAVEHGFHDYTPTLALPTHPSPPQAAAQPELEPDGGNMNRQHKILITSGQFWRCKHGRTGLDESDPGCKECDADDSAAQPAPSVPSEDIEEASFDLLTEAMERLTANGVPFADEEGKHLALSDRIDLLAARALSAHAPGVPEGCVMVKRERAAALIAELEALDVPDILLKQIKHLGKMAALLREIAAAPSAHKETGE